MAVRPNWLRKAQKRVCLFLGFLGDPPTQVVVFLLLFSEKPSEKRISDRQHKPINLQPPVWGEVFGVDSPGKGAKHLLSQAPFGFLSFGQFTLNVFLKAWREDRRLQL